MDRTQKLDSFYYLFAEILRTTNWLSRGDKDLRRIKFDLIPVLDRAADGIVRLENPQTISDIRKFRIGDPILQAAGLMHLLNLREAEIHSQGDEEYCLDGLSELLDDDIVVRIMADQLLNTPGDLEMELEGIASWEVTA